MERWLYSQKRIHTVGRELDYVMPSRGKRHFWGEKGKDYGFFTAQDQKNMIQRSIRIHRSLRSPAQQREYTGNYRYERQPHEIQSYNRRFKTQNSNFNEDDPQQMNNQSQLYKVKTEDVSLDKSNKSLIKSRQIKLLSPNVQVTLPEIKRHKIREEINNNQKQLQRMKTKQTKQQKLAESPHKVGDRVQEQRVFFYGRKNRKMNPTFCNSYLYPLPYHQHV